MYQQLTMGFDDSSNNMVFEQNENEWILMCHHKTMLTDKQNYAFTELQIREGIDDNSKIIFLVSRRKQML